MLDDLAVIHERDAHDALGVATRQWPQLKKSYDVTVTPLTVTNIVYAAMGSSALAAELVQDWIQPRVPLQIVRDYTATGSVPITSTTLLIAASYSGNTEETLELIADAESRGAHIVVIAAGGKLVDYGKAHNHTVYELPKAEEARFGILNNVRALVELLVGIGVVGHDNAIQELESAADFVIESVQDWQSTVPTSKNMAKQLAHEVIGRSIVIYSGAMLRPAAYKWKIGFNENAKQVAWTGQLPEFSHNEFSGWTKQPTEKPYAVIDLRSSFEHPRVQKRFELTERLLSGLRPAPETVQAHGDTPLEQLFWTCALGDFVSVYTGLLNGVNPMPVPLVDTFKKLMEE